MGALHAKGERRQQDAASFRVMKFGWFRAWDSGFRFWGLGFRV